MADMTLVRPAPQQEVILNELTDARLVLGFPMNDALVEKKGDHLVFVFPDGGRLVLNAFYTAFTQSTLPEFSIDGQTVAGAEFFAALGEDLMPAAGSAAQSVAQGEGSSATFGAAELLGGLDRLDGLDLTTGGSPPPVDGVTPLDGVATVATVATDGVLAAATPGLTPPPAPTVTPPITPGQPTDPGVTPQPGENTEDDTPSPTPPTTTVVTGDNTDNELGKPGGDNSNDLMFGDVGGSSTVVTEGKPYNIGIMLDISGSMETLTGYDAAGHFLGTNQGISRYEAARNAITNLVESLAGHDSKINLSLITFDHSLGSAPIFSIDGSQQPTVYTYSYFSGWQDKLATTTDPNLFLTKVNSYLDDFKPRNGETNQGLATDAATTWLKGLGTEATNETHFYLVTDGDPSRPETVGKVEAFKNSLTPPNAVHAVGMGTAAEISIGNLNLWDTDGSAQIVNNPSDLQQALISGGSIEQIQSMGADVMHGGQAHDILFGETFLFTDATGTHSGLEAVRLFVQDKTGESLSNAELLAYIHAHPAEFDLGALGGNKELGKGDALFGNAGDDIIFGQDGNDLLAGDGNATTFDALADHLHVDLSGLGSQGTQAEAIANLVDHIQEMDDAALGKLASWSESVLEARDGGDDLLFGGVGDDVIFGFEGDDKLYGGAGNDILFGGSGNDVIDGGAGEDRIFAGSGNDIILYDADDALIDGGSGIDFLVGVEASDLNAIFGSNSKVTDVEVIVMNGPTSPTNLADMKAFESLGISVNAAGDQLVIGDGWHQNTTPGFEVPDDYAAYTNDDMTILVQKNLFETSNG